MRSHLSIVGLLLGALFFAFSLTPSLLPRPFLIQGALSGLAFAAGYGLGVATMSLWNYLQLPLARGRAALAIKAVAAVISIVVAVSFLWHASHWQSSIRTLCGAASFFFSYMESDGNAIPTSRPARSRPCWLST